MGRPRKYTDEHKDEIIYLYKQYPEMSQTKIAKQVGCSQGYVSKVINNYSEYSKKASEGEKASSEVNSLAAIGSILSDSLTKLNSEGIKDELEIARHRAICYLGRTLYQIWKEQGIPDFDDKKFLEEFLLQMSPECRDLMCVVLEAGPHFLRELRAFVKSYQKAGATP